MPDFTVAFAAGFGLLYSAVAVECFRTGRVPNAIVYLAGLAALLIRPDGIGVVPLVDFVVALGVGLVGVLLYSRGAMNAGVVKLAAIIPLTHGANLGLAALGVGVASLIATGLALTFTRTGSFRDWVPAASYFAGIAALSLFWRFTHPAVLVAALVALWLAGFLLIVRRRR